jgi:hypothetical protein
MKACVPPHFVSLSLKLTRRHVRLQLKTFAQLASLKVRPFYSFLSVSPSFPSPPSRSSTRHTHLTCPPPLLTSRILSRTSYSLPFPFGPRYCPFVRSFATNTDPKQSLSITVNALSAAGDALIAGVLCFILNKIRTGFRKTDTMINILVSGFLWVCGDFFVALVTGPIGGIEWGYFGFCYGPWFVLRISGLQALFPLYEFGCGLRASFRFKNSVSFPCFVSSILVYRFLSSSASLVAECWVQVPFRSLVLFSELSLWVYFVLRIYLQPMFFYGFGCKFCFIFGTSL